MLERDEGGDGRVFKKNRVMIKNSCYPQPVKINQNIPREQHLQIQHSIHRYLAETSFLAGSSQLIDFS